MKNTLGYFFVLFVLLAACQDNSTDPQTSDALIRIKVDLQYGFSGKVVSVSFNGEQHYYSILSENVSRSGPEASFTTYLAGGENRVQVYLQDIYNWQNSERDSAVFTLGINEIYYLGLRIYDRLEVSVRDSMYLYL